MAKPQIGEEEKQAVLSVLDSGILAQGPRVQAFEESFAGFSGVPHAIATSSGTTALHTILLALGIGPGDEVVTSAFTFIASANSIIYVGARPVFVDIVPETFNINAELLEAAITPHTKAILPIHLFGLACDMDRIMAIAKKYNLFVVEDACQSHGAEYQGRKTGSFGLGAFSFYPTKNMTSGEGGMITTYDPAIAEKCRIIRQHGMRKRYYHEEIGFNFRMSDLHAAIGLEQLKKLDHFNRIRQTNAEYFNSHLRSVILPSVPQGYRHVYHQYTIRVPGGKRDLLREYLMQKGVGSEIYYPVPIHLQSLYTKKLGYNISLPETEQAAKEVLSLPIHPALCSNDLEIIVENVNKFMAG